MNSVPHLAVQNLTMAYGDAVIQENLSFSVQQGEIFVIMGGSGCGKSTLLRHLVGLMEPAQGDIFVNGTNFWETDTVERNSIISRSGVLYQGGALWSSLTLAENLAVPLMEFTKLSQEQISEVISFKLSLVGLSGFEDHYPSEISGGMKKRAGLARAIVLDPDILFFDEPSAGLAPLITKMIFNSVKRLNKEIGLTVLMIEQNARQGLQISHRGYVLELGKNSYEGTGQELLDNEEVRRAFLGGR